MKRFLGVVLFSAFLAGTLTGCSGGGSSSSSSNSSNGGVNVTGTLDSGTITLVSNEHGVRRFLAYLLPSKAYAAGVTVDNVVAISRGGTFILATKSGNSFTLNLPKGKDYIVVLLNGTTIVGVYKADSTTGMNTFPLGSNSTDINLGTITINSGTATGTITSPNLLQNLGLSQNLAHDIGIMDVGMRRFSSVDVDGNGVMDYLENKSYEIRLDYEFSGGAYSAIQGAFSNYATASYKGYEYYFFAYPDDPALNWGAANINPPTAITPASTYTNGSSTCYQDHTSGATLNFYCGGGAAAPATPPAGTYQVVVPSVSIFPLTTKTFTFQNVSSQTIDAVNLYNIYVPLVKLTMSGTQITQIDWQWWKHDQTSGTWVQPTDAELSAVLNNASFEIGQTNWAGARVRGTIGLTATGSVVPAAQGFTPAVFRVSYVDNADYHYGFEWQ